MNQADDAYRAVLDMLLRLEIAPGAAIVESDLVRTLGVGKTPLRDCLRRLESEKLVKIYPRRGTFASEVGLADLSLIADLREGLEGLVAATAARRATDIDRTGLEQLIDRMPQRNSMSQMAEDMSLHKAIYKSAHNEYMEETAIRYLNLSTRIWRMYVQHLPEKTIDTHMSQHQEILRRVINGDSGGAESHAKAHVRGFEAAIQQVM